MILKKLAKGLLLACSTLLTTGQASALDVVNSGYVHVPYVATTSNRVAEQGFGGIEAGLFSSVDITGNLLLRSLLTYEPAHRPQDAPIDFNFLLADAQVNVLDTTIGARLGRLEQNFGFWHELRNNPNDRLSPLKQHPFNMVWSYNYDLFNSVDGYSLYTYKNFGKYKLDFEYITGERNDLQPTVDYIQQQILSEITASKQKLNRGIQITFDGFDKIRIRHIELDMTTVFTIPDSHYDENWPIIPDYMRVIGDRGIDYKYKYNGVEFWANRNFFLLLETIDFFYTGTGTVAEYYSIFGLELEYKHNKFSNITLRYMINGIDIYYGYSMNEYDLDSTNPSKSNEYYYGVNYQYDDDIKLKGLIQQNNHAGWLLWSENEGKHPRYNGAIPDNFWTICALSAVYSF